MQSVFVDCICLYSSTSRACGTHVQSLCIAVAIVGWAPSLWEFGMLSRTIVKEIWMETPAIYARPLGIAYHIQAILNWYHGPWSGKQCKACLPPPCAS